MAVNKVILVGNVGKDPEVRYVESNVAVANFPLATSERGYTSRSGVQIPERTEWHNIVLWRGLAEVAEKYVKKGAKFYDMWAPFRISLGVCPVWAKRILRK